MGINFHIITDELTELEVEGITDLAEMLDAIKKIYAEKPPRCVLWNFTGGKIPQASSFEVEIIAKYTKDIIHSRKGGKTAIVAPNELVFGFARAYETFSEIFKQDISVAVFHDRSSAMEWLNQ